MPYTTVTVSRPIVAGLSCPVPAPGWRDASDKPLALAMGYLTRRLAKSKGQAKRLLLQGAVRINGQAVTAMEWEGDPHMLRYIWVAGHESTKARETQR